MVRLTQLTINACTGPALVSVPSLAAADVEKWALESVCVRVCVRVREGEGER